MSSKDKEELVQDNPEEANNGAETQETQEQVENENTQETELEKYKADLDKEKDKFLRLFAEFENYKRRTSKERIELFKTAGQEVMQAMLPVLDDFDRAMVEIAKSEDKELLKGVELISLKLKETLRNKGLEPVKVEQGDAFDAEIHEAITQIPAPQPKLKGKVVDVIEQGYKLGERIIRHPKVVVGQ
ncbi:MAG: nucleotide exchange factor GrpE [Cytophagaceae bacterium]|nr:nucleotide exchange factor GrpE [Cytophagaceae bacterium]|tara:strand:+ start:5286 stop:5846 length:561 start_codon:yes stop_codon:yes gene_type:complete